MLENKPEETGTENYIEVLLNKIKVKLILFMAVSGIILFAGLLFLFFFADKTIGICAIIFGLVYGALSYQRFGRKNKDNIIVVEAKCMEKSRSGYRKQYLEYTFQTDDEHAFVITTAQKEKFKKNIRYALCFPKSVAGEPRMYGNNLLAYEIL